MAWTAVGENAACLKSATVIELTPRSARIPQTVNDSPMNSTIPQSGTKRRVRVAIAVLLLVSSLLPIGALAASSESEPPPGIAALPGLILWAWERPEDLRFLDPRRVGVAYLAGTVRLSGDDVVVNPRRQPLFVPAGIQLIAVTRVEVDHSRSAALSLPQTARVAREVIRLSETPGLAAIQLDFDALRSERAFYRAVVLAIRRDAPSVSLSITALASWCLSDPWMRDLPIDEAVPMLFRMGRDAAPVLQRARSGAFADPRCRSSRGVSVDEEAGWLVPSGRTYVFNPQPWTPAQLGDVLRRLGEER